MFYCKNSAAYFLKTSNFTITYLKRQNSTSYTSIDLIFFMFLTIPSTNFDCISENQFPTLCRYLLLDRITYIKFIQQFCQIKIAGMFIHMKVGKCGLAAMIRIASLTLVYFKKATRALLRDSKFVNQLSLFGFS